MVAEVGWYNFRQQDLVDRLGFVDTKAKRGAPIVADWAIRNGSCPEEGKEPQSGYACVSANSYCMPATNGPGYLCQCSKGYEGNPYIQNGCQDIDECMLHKQQTKYKGTVSMQKRDVPMLVYEYVSNGTLSELLHNTNCRAPIPLNLRLKIAIQSAEALAYLHSSTSCTIIHGDVKSANILLDDQHNAKVADFGASALKPMDEREFIRFVQGTLGYLDPESFISHQLTEKSDVYSFGVVLLELITRKRAIYDDKSNKKKSLSYVFLWMFRQNKYRILLDSEVTGEANTEVLEKLAKLAVQCLRSSGDDRPKMKEVAECLQVLRRLYLDTSSDFDDIHYARNHHEGSLSTEIPLDEMTCSSMDTATVAWAQNLQNTSSTLNSTI
ncbi:hypothetical protein PR202_gb24293 [Eleusine coracana subsp. coracana]|uniref:Protein kinase domain-containing protein n=1 Tax=Eleusine coracana subsp. coracana TaxID=191504 RepID=A0AAV5FL33_ELECO|nr:hypothetical protein PR202_gb24293 [Eleusine coracana subsp. coracana]